MIRYVLNRLALVVVVALGVTTLLFVLSRISGDAAEIFAPPSASDAVLEATRERLGLNRPVLEQYLDTLRDALVLDFGSSHVFQQPAFSMILERLTPSLRIIIPSIIVTAATALIVGTVAALRPTKRSGRGIMIVAFITQGVPYFWFALVLVLVLAIKLRWVPATGSDGWRSLVIPVIVLGVFGASTMSRLVRGQLLDALGQPHLITARSKGLAPSRVLLSHALPTALPPLLAWLGIQFSFMFGALLVLEPILNYNGIGALLVRGVTGRDFPLVQAGVFFIAVLITLVNIALDVIVRIIDPRLRTKAAL